jgi:hypothetical protein
MSPGGWLQEVRCVGDSHGFFRSRDLIELSCNEAVFDQVENETAITAGFSEGT